MSNSSKKTAYLAGIIALLLVVGILGYKNIAMNKTLASYEKSIDETEQLKKEAEIQFEQAFTELEEMKGSNSELNSLIDEQKEELKKQRNRINSLIRSGAADKNTLIQAREELLQMKGLVENYVNEINILKNDNTALLSSNNELTTVKTELENNLNKAITTNSELTEEKAMLVSEKQKLQAIRENLSTKVTFASVIKVSEIQITGLKIRTSGKEVKKRYAKNIDKLRICFQTTINGLVKEGEEKYFIRILTPSGTTMAIESLGSGILVDNTTQAEVRYTTSTIKDYSSKPENVCLNWQPNTPFSKGIYKVEVYNKGYKAGAGEFRLK